MLTPPCEVIGHRISESFDRKLTWRERWSIAIHNLGCAICERYRRQMIALHNIVSRYADTAYKDEEILPQLSDAAKEQIRAAMRSEAS